MKDFSLAKARSQRVPLAVWLVTITVVLVGIGVMLWPWSPATRATSVPAAAPAATPVDLSQAPVVPVEPPPGELTVGRKAEVTGTDSCLNVRERPGLDAAVNFCLEDGTVITLVEGPLENAGNRWWRVSEYTGWAVETFLKPRSD